MQIFGLKVFYGLFLKVWSTSSSGFIVDVWSAILVTYLCGKESKQQTSSFSVGIGRKSSLLARPCPLIRARTLDKIGKRHQLNFYRRLYFLDSLAKRSLVTQDAVASRRVVSRLVVSAP